MRRFFSFIPRRLFSDVATASSSTETVALPAYYHNVLGKNVEAELNMLLYREHAGMYERVRVKKSSLMAEAGVEARDLRKLLSISQRQQIGSVLVRPTCVILHLEHVKCLIMHDRLYLFDAERVDQVARFAMYLPSLLYQPSSAPSKVPFERRALEAILVEVTETLDSELKAMQPATLELLTQLAVSQRPDKLRRLFEITNALNALYARARALRAVINELLASDEDMAGMYLSAKAALKPHAAADHNEIEALLEHYLQQEEETEWRVHDLVQRTHATEAYIRIHFDAQRNRLMRMNLVLSMGTLSVGGAALGAGLFGMNLQSGLETHPHAFAFTAASLAVFSSLSFLGMYSVYARSKYLPRLERGASSPPAHIVSTSIASPNPLPK